MASYQSRQPLAIYERHILQVDNDPLYASLRQVPETLDHLF
jgi:hypothetical protein